MLTAPNVVTNRLTAPVLRAALPRQALRYPTLCLVMLCPARLCAPPCVRLGL